MDLIIPVNRLTVKKLPVISLHFSHQEMTGNSTLWITDWGCVLACFVRRNYLFRFCKLSGNCPEKPTQHSIKNTHSHRKISASSTVPKKVYLQLKDGNFFNKTKPNIYLYVPRIRKKNDLKRILSGKNYVQPLTSLFLLSQQNHDWDIEVLTVLQGLGLACNLASFYTFVSFLYQILMSQPCCCLLCVTNMAPFASHEDSILLLPWQPTLYPLHRGLKIVRRTVEKKNRLVDSCNKKDASNPERKFPRGCPPSFRVHLPRLRKIGSKAAHLHSIRNFRIFWVNDKQPMFFRIF